MKLFGKLWPSNRSREKALSTVSTGRGWYRIMEPFTGAWQRNISIDLGTVAQNPVVFACTTLIASDIAKLRVKLVQRNPDGIWSEVSNPAYSPVLRRPNHYQTRIQFWEYWILSKLLFGNTYVLKRRDNRRVVTDMYILDPRRVQPMVSDDGSVFYKLMTDDLSSVEEEVMVPASEIIHDRYNCLYHPLVGLSPIYANGVAATQGIIVLNSSAKFFGNRSMPGGVLTAPGAIAEDTAKRLKDHWDANYSGDNAGKVAVLGDGLTFQPIASTSRDSQLVEQLKWTAEAICATYHVPLWKVGLAPMPSTSNIQALNVEYYSQALQKLIEDAENCLDDGLSMSETIGTEFDTEGLLRMDTLTQLEVLDKAKSVMTLDERRRRLDMPRITGGDTVYLQQQDHSIEAIAARDRLLIEEANKMPEEIEEIAPVNDNSDELEAAKALVAIHKGLR